MKLHQLAGRIGQMLQHIQTDHRVETLTGKALEIAMHGEPIFKTERCRALGNKRAVLGIEIHKPHVPNVAQPSGREGMGADKRVYRPVQYRLVVSHE